MTPLLDNSWNYHIEQAALSRPVHLEKKRNLKSFRIQISLPMKKMYFFMNTFLQKCDHELIWQLSPTAVFLGGNDIIIIIIN